MTQAAERSEDGGPLAPVVTPLERLEYIGELTAVLERIASEGGFERLSAMLALAVSEVEVLQEGFWTGCSDGKFDHRKSSHSGS
jgi:hypothetical protein